MKQKVLLNVIGRQTYDDQEPDVIELTTEGYMEYCDGGWEICYEESDLTGMQGVTTLFRVEPERVVLTRSGKLHSQMIFRPGKSHESLYQMEFGALMICVTTQHMFFDIVPEGGVIDVVYEIVIENSAIGLVDYHLDIRAIE